MSHAQRKLPWDGNASCPDKSGQTGVVNSCFSPGFRVDCPAHSVISCWKHSDAAGISSQHSRAPQPVRNLSWNPRDCSLLVAVVALQSGSACRGWSVSEWRALLRQLLFMVLALCWCVHITSAFPARLLRSCGVGCALSFWLLSHNFHSSQCWVVNPIYIWTEALRLHFSEYLLRPLFWDVKAFQTVTTNLISWILALRSVLLTEGYPSAAFWELLSQGMGAVRAELAGAMSKCTILSFQVSSCFDRNLICCVWCFPTALLEMEAGKGELGKMCLQFFMQKSSLNKLWSLS